MHPTCPPSCHACRCLQDTSVTLQPLDLPLLLRLSRLSRLETEKIPAKNLHDKLPSESVASVKSVAALVFRPSRSLILSRLCFWKRDNGRSVTLNPRLPSSTLSSPSHSKRSLGSAPANAFGTRPAAEIAIHDGAAPRRFRRSVA